MKVNCSYTSLKDIDLLTPHPRNPNKHPTKQIKMLAKIMKHQGWRHPVTVSNRSGFVIAGHGRIDAARLNGWKEIPIDEQDFESEADEYAHLIADNKIQELAESDEDLIQEIALDLGPDFDFDLFGIEDFEIKGVDTLPPGGEDDVPQEPAEATAKLGQIYKLGNHTVMCGDSEKDIETLLNGIKVDLTFTSPPYNANTAFVDVKNSGPLYENYDDNKEESEYVDFCSKILGNCLANTEGWVFWNVNYNSNTRAAYIKQIYAHLDYLDETVCWKKTALPVAYGLTRTWEPIFIFNNLGDKKRIGEKFKTAFNYWDISNIGSLDKTHRAAFPVALPEKAIELCSPKTLLDPFGGTGTTLIAAEKKNLSCYMMELEPKYIDVIIKRWETYTGNKSELIKNV